MNNPKITDPTVVILGHVCIDENSIEGASYRSWGSPAMYVSAYYDREYGIKTNIISEYGTDFAEYIHDFTVMATAPRGEHTLIYRNIVENGHRTQFCPNTEDSPPVSLDAQVADLIASADILIVAPNIPDYSSSYMNEAVSLAGQSTKKVLIPQGLLRIMDDQDLVTRGSLNDPSILGLFDAVIMSDEEIDDAIETAATWSKDCTDTSIIITRAEEGATLLRNGRRTDIPTDRPLEVHEIINPVGAGDMFSAEIAMKLFEGVSTEEAVKSAHVSTAKMLTARKQQDL